ncbi:MAG: thymidylate kinase, partial [Verrucomicrobia bacterium]|nr:thymidylate kinase [Verrucomicrobiota bacterium]
LFKADLEVSLGRILSGRPELKFFEAGMDLHLAPTREESFKIFQGRMLEKYVEMKDEFGFTVIDANGSIEKQQSEVRKLVASQLDLSRYALPK